MNFRNALWASIGLPMLCNAAFAATVTGTNADDHLFFNGVYPTTLIGMTITSGSGYSTTLDGSFNVNVSTYDGLAGADTLSMTNVGDVLDLDSVENIERILAGEGNDVIYAGAKAQGNLIIEAGPEDDIVFSSVGNDAVFGRMGNDLIDSGRGNDIQYGGDGDDTFIASHGLDIYHGQSGDDTLWFFDTVIYDILGVAELASGPSFALNSGCTDPLSTVISFKLSGEQASACTTGIETFLFGSTSYSREAFIAAYPAPDLSVVPLPASMLGMLSALGSLFGLRLWRRLRGRGQDPLVFG